MLNVTSMNLEELEAGDGSPYPFTQPPTRWHIPSHTQGKIRLVDQAISGTTNEPARPTELPPRREGCFLLSNTAAIG